MAATRAKTGNSKPRTFPKNEEVKAPVKTSRKKTGGVTKKAASVAKTAKTKAVKATKPAKTTKANTSKPRAKKEATAKVTKPAAKKKAATPVKKTATPKPKKAASATPKVEPKKETAAEPTHEPSLVDTAKGLLLKAQGVITGSSGKKAAGTAKIRGTDNKKPTPKKAKA